MCDSVLVIFHIETEVIEPPLSDAFHFDCFPSCLPLAISKHTAFDVYRSSKVSILGPPSVLTVNGLDMAKLRHWLIEGIGAPCSVWPLVYPLPEGKGAVKFKYVLPTLQKKHGARCSARREQFLPIRQPDVICGDLFQVHQVNQGDHIDLNAPHAVHAIVEVAAELKPVLLDHKEFLMTDFLEIHQPDKALAGNALNALLRLFTTQPGCAVLSGDDVYNAFLDAKYRDEKVVAEAAQKIACVGARLTLMPAFDGQHYCGTLWPNPADVPAGDGPVEVQHIDLYNEEVRGSTKHLLDNCAVRRVFRVTIRQGPPRLQRERAEHACAHVQPRSTAVRASRN
jgi:hypothetical protein